MGSRKPDRFLEKFSRKRSGADAAVFAVPRPHRTGMSLRPYPRTRAVRPGYSEYRRVGAFVVWAIYIVRLQWALMMHSV